MKHHIGAYIEDESDFSSYVEDDGFEHREKMKEATCGGVSDKDEISLDTSAALPL